MKHKKNWRIVLNVFKCFESFLAAFSQGVNLAFPELGRKTVQRKKADCEWHCSGSSFWPSIQYFKIVQACIYFMYICIYDFYTVDAFWCRWRERRRRRHHGQTIRNVVGGHAKPGGWLWSASSEAKELPISQQSRERFRVFHRSSFVETSKCKFCYICTSWKAFEKPLIVKSWVRIGVDTGLDTFSIHTQAGCCIQSASFNLVHACVHEWSGEPKTI